MKHLLLGLSLTLLATTAYAADAVVDEVVVVDGAYNWSGAYVGGHIGYGWSDNEVTSAMDILDIFEVIESDDGDGVLGGLQAGYNWQTGNIVYGGEIDVTFANIESNRYWATSLGDIRLEERLNAFGTLRGRLGYAFDRFLPYVTGGLAVGQYEVSNFDRDESSETHVGWTLGGGVEMGVTEAISLKLEYLYADFGSEEHSPQYNIAGDPMTVDLDPSLQTVRFGVNYRF